MNTATEPLVPAIGQPFAGGFYAGQIRIGDQTFALVRAPKAEGEHPDTPWNDTYGRVEGALSYCDGLANTEAMAAAGSKVAQWARAQVIGGFADWYIPAQDELEILYRAFKPTSEENYLYGRSGLNASAVPPTYPYTAEAPVQTSAEAFQDGGAEACDPAWYWSSTQHAGDDDYAWCQLFGDGGQYSDHKVIECRVVLVRRVAI